MPPQPAASRGPHRRADGNRNHESVLRAACEVLADDGPDASLEEVARRAGVGVGTVYRHVGSREALHRSVALVAMRVVADVARRALTAPDVRTGLVGFMAALLDRRVAGVVLVLRDVIDLAVDDELALARVEAWVAVEELVHRSREAGALRPGVTSADLGLLLARLDRPLHGPLGVQDQAAATARHLHLLVEGLAPGGRRAARERRH